MPHASHRLDILVVAARPDQNVELAGLQSLLDAWDVDERGRTTKGIELIVGGFERVWIDQPGRLLLYANQTGGFRAFCPVCRTNISADFGAAHLAWKRGGSRKVVCAECGHSIKLEDVCLQPPGSFSSWALVFSGALGADLTDAAKVAVKGAVGEYRIILRRP